MRKKKKSAKLSLKRTGSLMEKADKPVEILGLSIFGTRKSELLRKIWLQRKEMLHVATVNSEYFMERRANPRFAAALSHSLTVADGWGVVWANRILNGTPIPDRREPTIRDRGTIERISGVEIVEEILKHANERGEKVFLLGAAPGVAELAANRMQAKYPGARLAWWQGAQTVAVEKSEEASMTIAKINAEEPDYLLVAYGSPWQDIWIEDNRPYLRVRVAIGVGGVLDEWAGRQAPCPAWLDRNGGKWLWRLFHEPKRIGRIVRVFGFGLWVWYEKLKELL